MFLDTSGSKCGSNTPSLQPEAATQSRSDNFAACPTHTQERLHMTLIFESHLFDRDVDDRDRELDQLAIELEERRRRAFSTRIRIRKLSATLLIE